MKKAFCLLLSVLIVCAGFLGCEKSTTTTTSETTSSTTSSETTTSTPSQTTSTTTTTTTPSGTTTTDTILTQIPVLTVGSGTLDLTVGDALDLLEGVTATGLQGENLLSEVVVTHAIPVADGLVTAAGSYEVTYSLTVDGHEYTASRTVNVSEVPVINLISNGDFSSGVQDPFTKSDFEGAGSTVEIVDDGTGNLVLKLTITAVSWGAAAPRVEYLGLDLDPDKVYEISFSASAVSPRTMHVQIGQLLDADPWFYAAYGETVYFSLSETMQTYSWRFQPTASDGAALSDLGLLFEFGTMANGGTSSATTVYLDNFVLREVDSLLPDTTAPVLIAPTQTSFYTEDSFTVLNYISAIDEKGQTVTFSVVEAESTLPALDENGKLTTPGNYTVVYEGTDASGNAARLTWNFLVRLKPVTVNGFNLQTFLAGGEGNLSEDTVTGFVWSKNNDAVFSFVDGVLTVQSFQNAATDPWEATQIFARPVRVSGAGKYTISFDIVSDVAGVIEVNGNPYTIQVGSNHIAIEKYMFNYNYWVLSIQLGVYKGLQLPGGNIGPCTVQISNFSLLKTTTGPDVIAPVLTLKTVHTYFVGEAFDALSTVKIYDYRDSKAVIALVAEESTLPPVDENGLLTTAGVYPVTFTGTDATGNTVTYHTYYVVRNPLTDYDGFSLERVIYGTQAELDDPSTAYLWNNDGVNVTSGWIDANNFTITSDQSLDAGLPWYATQLFLKTLPVATKGLYTLSYDIVSDTAGFIKVNDELVELVVGTTHIEKQICLDKGSFYSISIQWGKEEYGIIGPFSAEIRNLSCLYVEQPAEPTWEGYLMTAAKVGTTNVISYENIPDPWYQANARTYYFETSNLCEAVVISFLGTAGHTYEFKFEGMSTTIYNSTQITADGTIQKVIIDTRNRTEAQRLSLCKLLVFCTNTGVSGQISIFGYEMFDSFGDAFDTEWFGMGGATVVDDAVSSIVTYGPITDSWWNANAQHELDSFVSTATTVTFTFQGVAGHEYLFKIEGGGYSKEASVIGTGELQTFVLDVSSISEANRAKLNLLVVFCKTVGASGTITLYSYTIG